MRASVASSTDSIAPSPAPKGVPRRFGLGMLFVWTTLFSGLFLLTGALDIPWTGVATISGFFAIIALAQWYFGEGRRAREASMIVGAVYYPIAIVIVLGPQDVFVSAMRSSTFALQGALIMVIGAVLGYLAGVLVAGVFLVAYWIDRAYAKWRNRSSEIDWFA